MRRRRRRSGVWAAGNGDTIYLHQVGQTVAGCASRPLEPEMPSRCIMAPGKGDKIDGSWRRVSPPVDGMPAVLGGHWDADIVNAIPRLNFREMLSIEPDYDGWWTKLHDAVDQTPTMSIRPPAYLRDDSRYIAQGREGGTATFTVSPAHFPAEARFTYRWAVSAGGDHFGGTGELEEPSITLTELPSAGTAITVSVEVRDDAGSQYEGTYEFMVLPPLAPDDRSCSQAGGARLPGRDAERVPDRAGHGAIPLRPGRARRCLECVTAAFNGRDVVAMTLGNLYGYI